MTTAEYIITYGLIAFQHGRVGTRDLLKDGDTDLLVPLWLVMVPFWPVVDVILLGMEIKDKFPTFSERIFIAAPSFKERKQVKRQTLKNRNAQLLARNAELEKELQLGEHAHA